MALSLITDSLQPEQIVWFDIKDSFFIQTEANSAGIMVWTSVSGVTLTK